MAKSIHNNVLDAALDYIRYNGDEMYICSAEPTSYAEASSTYALASALLLPSHYTIDDGDSSGRKVTIAQQSDILVDSTGDATHIAICNGSDTELILVTTCTSQSLTSGNTVTVPAFDDEIADPS